MSSTPITITDFVVATSGAPMARIPISIETNPKTRKSQDRRRRSACSAIGAPAETVGVEVLTAFRSSCSDASGGRAENQEPGSARSSRLQKLRMGRIRLLLEDMIVHHLSG